MRAVVVALSIVAVMSRTVAADTTDAPADDDAAEEPTDPPGDMSRQRTAAWIFAGFAIAAATGGIVMTIAAEASERDLEDLYDFRIGGRPPAFDGAARDRYDAVIAQGERYEALAWIGVSLAVAAGGTAAFLFYRDRNAVRIAPQVRKDGAGVAATITF
jgi:hypothetical protein